ncbi:2'-5' RNA ligase family protein [Francisella sp. 19X1-34]|uniref:2'-5' RNA ligase family protein n=1 Tax=Francisella sp. 19X1-34 TaxID=3087177 RepID=UPI002E33D292|nr:2'-5' RNA ligase family protein [Francisella sp. 19X1-34]MED7789641.1 2'-5' RNA ligase family protein [Francisella sp. 19X1-34]
MNKRIFSKLLLTISIILITCNVFAESLKQYNIYLIPSDKATKYVRSFDDSLEKTNVLKKYNTKPFIENHPVHLTLYLTSFDSKNIPDIEKQLAEIAKNISPFDIKTDKFIAGKSGFVMLNIQNSPELQRLSNKAVTDLAKYRNKNYPAPSWVKYYPTKLESFKKYGSPNTFNQFNPHFSILAADLDSDKARANFEKDFDQIIQNTKLKPASFKIKAIGFGEVDKYGQVTKPLYIFNLKG